MYENINGREAHVRFWQPRRELRQPDSRFASSVTLTTILSPPPPPPTMSTTINISRKFIAINLLN